MNLPYTASTDDEETSAEVNIRIVLNSILTNSRAERRRDLQRRSSALACGDRGFESHRGHGYVSCCEGCLLSGRGLGNGLIMRPEESYRLCRVVVCDQETLTTRRL